MMTTPASGEFFFVDDYGTIFETYWETIASDFGELLDTTSVVKQLYVWGQPDDGHIDDRRVFRRGICTTTRTVLKLVADGYLILAEGQTQETCEFPVTFSCAPHPTDPFKYHLDHDVCDGDELVVTCGPRWADVDDAEVVWPTVDLDGSIEIGTGEQPIEWVSIWTNDEELNGGA